MRLKLNLSGFLSALALSFIVGGILVGCKHKNKNDAQVGGGTSTQSVVTVKGNAHAS